MADMIVSDPRGSPAAFQMQAAISIQGCCLRQDAHVPIHHTRDACCYTMIRPRGMRRTCFAVCCSRTSLSYSAEMPMANGISYNDTAIQRRADMGRDLSFYEYPACIVERGALNHVHAALFLLQLVCAPM
jgi:hypothetical protein